jgi:hypothetical protein
MRVSHASYLFVDLTVVVSTHAKAVPWLSETKRDYCPEVADEYGYAPHGGC